MTGTDSDGYKPRIRRFTRASSTLLILVNETASPANAGRPFAPESEGPNPYKLSMLWRQSSGN
jgi:hypothetical protein